jgi:hypothetical protein
LFDIFKGKESPVSHKMELSFSPTWYLGMYVWCLSCRLLSLATSFMVLLRCLAISFKDSVGMLAVPHGFSLRGKQYMQIDGLAPLCFI